MLNRKIDNRILLGLLISFSAGGNQVLASDVKSQNYFDYSRDNLSSMFPLETDTISDLDFSPSVNIETSIAQNSQISDIVEVAASSIFTEEITNNHNPKIDFSPTEIIPQEITQLYLHEYDITSRAIVPNLTPEKATIQLPSTNTEALIAQNTQVSENIEVVGNSIFAEEIEDIIKQNRQPKIDLAQAEKIAQEITQLYLNEGYITSRAIVSNLTPETATIQVLEGGVEEIIIEGAQRLENYVRDRIALGAKTPLNTEALEDQLRLLKVDPLIEKIEASLRKGDSEQQSIIAVTVQEADPFFGTVGIDNYSPPSIGDIRANISLGYGNVFGWGDSFSVDYYPRIENWTGTYELDIAYKVPLNAMNGAILARVSLQENEVINGIGEELNITGDSQLYELLYRQPVLRNPREELAFSVGMRYREGQTFIDGIPVSFATGSDEKDRTNVLVFGQDYVKRNKYGAWGFQSEFRLGIGLFDVTSNTEGADGYFFSWLGQVQRVQVLSPDNLLIINAQLQLSDRPLLSSEQFVIGGGDSVKGYRENVRAGDNGFLFSIEDRITVLKNDELEPVLQLAPFFNMGSVWNNVNNPVPEPEETFIAALGLGVIWQPLEGLNIRVDYAPPLIDLVDRGNNIQDDGLYFNLQYEL